MADPVGARDPLEGRADDDAGLALARRPLRAERVLRKQLRDRRADAWNAVRRLTGGPRALPDFLIIGAQRAGTTSLFRYLASHPSVEAAARKEVHFFDLNWHRGEAWYRAHFARRGHAGGVPSVIGEASPYYLFHPLAPERVASLLPAVRVIVMLRDPVSRAYSHYHHVRAHGFEHLSFEDALLAETERLRGEEERLVSDPCYRSFSHQHHSYVARGDYLPQLQRWASHVPPERTLVVVSEEFYADPDAEFRRVTRFLGVPDTSLSSYERTNSQRYPPMSPGTKASLRALFAEPNRALETWLGRSLPWATASRERSGG
jgi:hypothetical protein